MKNHFRVVLACLAVSLFLAGAYSQGGKKSDPKSQTLAVFKAIKARDWKGLYSLIAFPASVKGTLPGPEQFAKDAEAGFQNSGDVETAKQVLAGMKNLAVGEPKITGNRAKVPTSCTITFRGATHQFSGAADMILENGAWKWDLTQATAATLERATSAATQKLIGTPKSKSP